jgi:hypothetical protein
VVVDTVSGTGAITASGSRSGLNYSTTYTIKATLTTSTTTPGRGNPDPVTTTRKTEAEPPPPPTPSVTISRGAENSVPFCEGTCYNVHLRTSNFTKGYTCYADDGRASYIQQTFSGPVNRDVTQWRIPAGRVVTVTCNDFITSNKVRF